MTDTANSLEKGSGQPDWIKPIPRTPEPVLRVYNSMTKSKDVFVPMNGRLIKWYNCGPTVYDASHLGHARNYVTQDIIRRILTDYFGYDIHFVMNVTDIDDKIIQRARHLYLVKRLRDQSNSLDDSLIADVKRAFASYLQSKLVGSLSPEDVPRRGEENAVWVELFQKAKSDPAWTEAGTERDEKFSMHITSLNTTFNALEVATEDLSSGRTGKDRAEALIDSSSDILGPYLDSQFKAEVKDHSIFRSLAAYWEGEFMADMNRLKVAPPDALTRVTEYVPEIVTFVEKIIQRGYAVYFDTTAFDGAKREWSHFYAKLMPWNKGDKELLEEGEGALTSGKGKRSAVDFALWKASKPGEPAWPSPWGEGRPGWHIECSVMATELLGDNMDIHSGGIDLAFPHHDNEIAQSEAFHDCRQWVNYFLHTGHLHIEGLKMSKSLKNFITIREALNLYTARQLRLAFLGHLWNAKMDFRGSAIAETKAIEATFDNFFTVVKALINEANVSEKKLEFRHHYNAPERELTEALHQTQHALREALCDSFNTPEALARLNSLVSLTNVYLGRGRSNVNIDVVKKVAAWVTKMLRVFGLGEGPLPLNGIGWGTVSSSQETDGPIDREAMLTPYISVLSRFRDDVRRLAISQAPAKEILSLSDRLRDQDLVPLGVALDDQEDGRALVKLVDPVTLVRAREEKNAALAEKAAKKAAQAEADKAKKLAKLERGKLDPLDMFKPPHEPEGTYGIWDENGLPLTDAQGVEIPKSRRKKLTKLWDEQKKLHADYLAWTKAQSTEP
ncbi:uncharacterized protein EI90DRAFT_3146492 [Cantharellus anzutake]|uniref:uncharacterized protein n=1 Tax=Cantharellus anzutake TaxID=1750568 RepID=UPI001902DF52|nr:uncharacterized protein EI90DRAFT_3146492 [Cantharellus anzutake]KAF8326622.1 hypothetical protein EI90DRAFT_3146492 [Cantharellus anzutake]